MTVLAFATACTTARTEVIIVMDTDFDVPREIDTFEAAVTAPDGRVMMVRASLGGSEAPLPRTVGVVHTEGPLGTFTVEATALLAGSIVMTRRARFDFVEKETRVLEVFFLRSCAMAGCSGDETCDASGCRSIDIDPSEMPTYTGSIVGLQSDVDAAIDSGADGDADSMVDSGMDAPDAGPCPSVCNGGCAGGECLIITPTLDTRCPAGRPCRINCDVDGSCPERLHCPEDGQPCVVSCLGDNSCARATDCESASTCEVICTGMGSCAGNNNCKAAGSCMLTCDGIGACGGESQCRGADCSVVCSGFMSCDGPVGCDLGGRCDITCSGMSSCATGTVCTDACACSVMCDHPSACAVAAMCPTGCDDGGGGCMSAGACDMCP